MMSFAANLSPAGSPVTLTVVDESALTASGHSRYTPTGTLVVFFGTSELNPNDSAIVADTPST